MMQTMRMMLMTADQKKTHSDITAVIIAAAGSSSRMGGSVKKQYLPLRNGTILSEAVKPFLSALHCSILAVTIPAGENGQEARNALAADPECMMLLGDTPLLFVCGGSTRQASVKNALEAIAASGLQPDIVLIHDAARPFVTPQIIRDAACAASEYGAAVPAVQPVDTQKETDGSGCITRHLKRDMLAAVQTPQAFRFTPLLDAHRKAEHDGNIYTDDTEIYNRYEGSVRITVGDVCNRKITYSSDMENKMAASAILRTGLGYDIHPLAAGRKLILGGVVIPYEKGELGHSDGDALLHAVTDALLGASGMGDIGSFFPPEDDTWKDADSSLLLSTVWKKITAAGWKLCNIDCVVKLEKPKLLPYRDEIRASIASVLKTSSENVFVKGKTGEKMGETGAGNAVEAWCSCLLAK